MLLPQIAAYFDISIDDLLGYEPQMSKEQIKKCYQEFTVKFANKPFESVMKETRVLVNKYYSCYPLLLQICVLWENHFMLADSKEMQETILNTIADLCSHIINDCKEIKICNDAIMLKASIDLQLGKAQEVVDVMEDILDPYNYMQQSDIILIQAYQMIGDTTKAEAFTQMSMYMHLHTLIFSSIQFLNLHYLETDIFNETTKRIDQIIDTFDLVNLSPNTTANYYYQVAAFLCLQKNPVEAIKRLQDYATSINSLINNDMILHGDHFFNELDQWIANSALGTHTVRDKKLIMKSVVESMKNPIFDLLVDNVIFQQILNEFTKKGESYAIR